MDSGVPRVPPRDVSASAKAWLFSRPRGPGSFQAAFKARWCVYGGSRDSRDFQGCVTHAAGWTRRIVAGIRFCKSDRVALSSRDDPSRWIVSVQTWLWLESSRGWMWRPLCGIRIWNFNFLLNWRLAKMNTFTPDTMNRSNRRLSKKLFCENKIFKNFTIAKYKWDYYIITYIFCCSFSLKKKNLFLLK